MKTLPKSKDQKCIFAYNLGMWFVAKKKKKKKKKKEKKRNEVMN